MKDIVAILRSLGLTDSEIKTYIAALEKGAGSAVDLTKATRLSRQAIYLAIESLTGRGLMTSALHGKKRFYSAEHPSTLLRYAERREMEIKERLEDLRRVLPEIELQMGGERPIVRVFEGKEGIRAIIQDMQEHPSDRPVELADLPAMKRVLALDDVKGVQAELKKNNARLRGLYAADVIGEKFSDDPIRGDRIFIPKELGGFHSSVLIFGNRIVFITYEEKMYSVIIESQPLVKAVHTLFELAIRGAKDFPNQKIE